MPWPSSSTSTYRYKQEALPKKKPSDGDKKPGDDGKKPDDGGGKNPGDGGGAGPVPSDPLPMVPKE
ncbi:hypothetical protein [Hoylesella marshii]|uniref:hypothetical protein n=1 Tax=Hoylesella marshii TaxID=189722 RepID=UPI0002E391A2|nr:hypothetical protein [Hoylesella marshii]